MQKGRNWRPCRAGGHHREDREDRADRREGLDIGGAVEGIDGHRERAFRIEPFWLVRLFGGKRGDRGLGECRADDIVGHGVQRLLTIAIPGVGDDLAEWSVQKPTREYFSNLPARAGERKDRYRHGAQIRPAGNGRVQADLEFQILGQNILPIHNRLLAITAALRALRL